MESEYQHRALVVDDDEQVRNIVENIFLMEKVDPVFVKNGESGLEKIKTAKAPFSLILTDQGLGGMKGTQFLEQAKNLSPHSIRFLMTGHSEIQTIIYALNQGAIQRYIVKPWKTDDLATAIRSGIRRYESFLEEERLLVLAKQQNTKLYDLNCELMETTKSHNKAIHDLDSEIEIIENQIKAFSSQKPPRAGALLDEIEDTVREPSGIDPEKLEALFSKTIKSLHDQFNEMAQRSGFEMPGTEGLIP